MPEHVSLPERKALLGKIAVLQAIEGRAHDVQPLVAQAFRDALSRWVTQQFTIVDNKTTLHAAIEELQQELARQTERIPHRGIVNELLASTLQAAANRTCTACNTGGRPCDGDPDRDDRIAIEGGVCIGPLAEAFQFALQTATELHRTYAPTVPTILWNDIRFATRDARGPVHELPSDIAISAKVDRRTHLTVTLTVWAERFDWDAYLALPYVLLHETLIHIPENASSDKPHAADPGHQFTEGWMDWVTKDALWEYLSTQTSGPPWMARSAAIEELHAARLKRPAASDNIERLRLYYAANRLLGARAAERFARFLHEPYVQRANAPALFRELSLRLNFLAAPDEAKEEFVVAIGRFLSRSSNLRHSASFELAHVVHEYTDTRDIEGFLAAVVSLSRSHSVDERLTKAYPEHDGA